jgi:predicted nucleic acid-binding protein
MHVAVAAELFFGSRDRAELRRAQTLVSTCDIVTPNETDHRRALHYLEQHVLANGPGWNDCLIAATATRLELPVLTLNEKHFRVFRGLRVIRPY